MSQKSQIQLPPLHWILIVQFILTIFIPPIGWGARNLFWGDAFFFIWPIPYLIQEWVGHPELRPILKKVLSLSALIFVIVFLHGAYRPSLVEQLAQVQMTLTEPDSFHLFREGIVTARFLSWLWAAVAVSIYGFSKRELELLAKTLVIGVIVGSLVMFVSKLFPDFAQVLGRVYGYDPNAFPWQGRIYGLFRSPNESGIYFGLAALVLFALPKDLGLARRIAMLCSVVSVALTQSLTAVLSWTFVLVVAAIMKLNIRARFAVLGTLALIGAAAYPSIFVPGAFLYGKLVNFVYRFGPWKVYVEAAASRWDLFLFGFGWPNYHVDNFYVFLLNRGGVLLLGAALVWGAWVLKSRWRTLSFTQKMVAIFILFSGLTIDTLILRPVVALTVCMTLPFLTKNEVEVSG